MTHATRDHWATETELTDDAHPFVIHSHEFERGSFSVLIAHTICDADLGTDFIVKWDEPGDRAGITHHEEFSVSMSRARGLVAALDEATRIVRGDADPIERAIEDLTETIADLESRGLHAAALTVAYSLIRLRTQALETRTAASHEGAGR